MKATFYPAAAALLAGTVAANNNADPSETKLPPVEEGVAESLKLEEGENEGLLPSAYTTLFKNASAEVTWGGRLYLDYGNFSADAAYMDPGAGVEFRTARFFAKGRIHDSIDFKIENEFAGNAENNFKDIYMGLSTPLGSVKVGHFKEPFSLEQLTSSRFITFMERSLGDVLVPGRNIGIQVSGYEENMSDLNWAAGIFYDSTDGGASTGDGEYSFTGRVCSTAWRNEDSSDLLHYGGGVSFRSDNAGVVDYDEEPEIHLLPDLGGTSAMPIAADGAFHWNLETAWVSGPTSVQAEYFMAMVDGGSGGMDADYSGYYVMASHFLTGEKRNYKAKGGKFDRIQVADNYDGGGGSGALELKARLSASDFDDGPTGNDTMNYALGVNWYLNPHTRIMFDYIHSEYNDNLTATDASLDGIMLRFQIDF